MTDRSFFFRWRTVTPTYCHRCWLIIPIRHVLAWPKCQWCVSLASKKQWEVSAIFVCENLPGIKLKPFTLRYSKFWILQWVQTKKRVALAFKRLSLYINRELGNLFFSYCTHPGVLSRIVFEWNHALLAGYGYWVRGRIPYNEIDVVQGYLWFCTRTRERCFSLTHFSLQIFITRIHASEASFILTQTLL